MTGYLQRVKKGSFSGGMALHNLADVFAHSTTVKGKRIKHDDDGKGNLKADKIDYYPKRWSCASKAVANALKLYNSSNVAGSWSDFYSVCSQDEFKLINIYENIKGAFGEGAAGYFKNKSQTMK